MDGGKLVEKCLMHCRQSSFLIKKVETESNQRGIQYAKLGNQERNY